MNQAKGGNASDDFARIVKPQRTNFCFVVMSLQGNPVLETYYKEAVQKTVEHVGLQCIRVDQQQFTGGITDQIRRNLDEARVVIVDTTEDRPNCYFEAGYAVARGKPIIWLRLNAPTMVKTGIEFDLKDYKHILYTTAEDLRIKLERELRYQLQL
jgi:hypothetical protein